MRGCMTAIPGPRTHVTENLTRRAVFLLERALRARFRTRLRADTPKRAAERAFHLPLAKRRQQVRDLRPHFLAGLDGLEDFLLQQAAVVLHETVIRLAQGVLAQAERGGEACGVFATEAAAALQHGREGGEDGTFPPPCVLGGEAGEDAGEEFAGPLAVEEPLGRLVVGELCGTVAGLVVADGERRIQAHVAGPGGSGAVPIAEEAGQGPWRGRRAGGPFPNRPR